VIVRALRARGYQIVTIPELLGFRPVYRPCAVLCDGIGVPRAALPRDAIVEPAPGPAPGRQPPRARGAAA
jgi:hypothetical protein